jgi:hypothetical protein
MLTMPASRRESLTRLSQDDRRRSGFHDGVESVVKIYGRSDAVPGL